MIIRERILERIRPFYDSDLIKVLIGLRRSGKSVILQQIREELLQKIETVIPSDDEEPKEGKL